jgi:hypothetical protein|tara:strand:- start:7697 stop:8137 length:441 start_codon:yes stop_codon:yes gene_type:complete
MKIAVIVIVIILIVIIGPKIFYRISKPKLEQKISELYNEDEIILKELKANCLGIKSKSVVQIRGNGVLILTKSHLRFFRILPKADYEIPINLITNVSITHTHLGKALPYKLVRLEFKGTDGPDAIAWWVSDQEQWKNKIELLINSS